MRGWLVAAACGPHLRDECANAVARASAFGPRAASSKGGLSMWDPCLACALRRGGSGVRARRPPGGAGAWNAKAGGHRRSSPRRVRCPLPRFRGAAPRSRSAALARHLRFEPPVQRMRARSVWPGCGATASRPVSEARDPGRVRSPRGRPVKACLRERTPGTRRADPVLGMACPSAGRTPVPWPAARGPPNAADVRGPWSGSCVPRTRAAVGRPPPACPFRGPRRSA